MKLKGKLEQYRESFRVPTGLRKEKRNSLVGIYAVETKGGGTASGTSVGSGEKQTAEAQKELALPKPDVSWNGQAFVLAEKLDRRHSPAPYADRFGSSCILPRSGDGQDNGKRCEGRGTADAHCRKTRE